MIYVQGKLFQGSYVSMKIYFTLKLIVIEVFSVEYFLNYSTNQAWLHGIHTANLMQLYVT